MAEPYHEPLELIPEPARDYHRAMVSMIEEFQAIDWYHQRAVATKDAELRAILEHNRDEEKEHASMLLEWMRRRDDALSKELKDFLFNYHRAMVSMIEEFQAIDWYHQRAVATKDAELRAILEHNRDEEKEHASMLLEWMRRRDDALSKELKDFLFTEGNIANLEKD